MAVSNGAPWAGSLNDTPPPDGTARTPLHVRSAAQIGLFVLALLAAVYFAQDMLVPVAFAFVLHVLLSPAVRTLDRVGVPSPLGAALTLLAIVSAILVLVYLLAAPAAAWFERIPLIAYQLQQKLDGLLESLQHARRATAQVEQLAKGPDAEAEVVLKGPGLLDRVAGNLGAIVVVLAITLILAYFLLASGDLFRHKLVHVMPRLQDKKRALYILQEIESQVALYLWTVTLVNLGVGAVVGGSMLAIGMPNPLLWAAVAAFLSFIPFIGTWIGIAAVTVVALLSFDDPGRAALAPAIYFLVHVAAENFVIPSVLGRRLTLNPVVILLNVVLWGWLWGVPGALLAGPILIMLRVLCDHFAGLAAVGEFLSGPQPGNGRQPVGSAA